MLRQTKFRMSDKANKADKGFVNIFELIIVVVALFSAYTFFFPAFSYKSNWNNALLVVQARDTILAMERTGKLYDYSFDANARNSFLGKVFPASNVLTWSKTTGAPKPTVQIACFCTNEQVTALSHWLDDIRINGRSVNFVISQTSLTNINPSDALLVWGYQDLSPPAIRAELEDYLKEGNGVVEVMDFATGTGIDNTQNDIFGINEYTGWGTDTISFAEPTDAEIITYQPYKFFYHLPIPLKATTPESNLGTCTKSNNTGTFAIRGNSYNFWICDGTKAYFDTNGNGVADTGPLVPGSTFTIEGFTFHLKYIDSATGIRVSFDPSTGYRFADFIKATDVKAVSSTVKSNEKALVFRENPSDVQKASGVVLNDYAAGRTAWVANFTRDGMASVGDDHHLLLASLLLWASNKETKGILLENLNVGFKTSYVNVNATDVYEVYTFDLGLGYPY